MSASSFAPETAQSATENTISGVKLTFTAKGLLQPEITLRYASAEDATRYAAAEAFALFDKVREQAYARHITLVTDAANA